MNLNIDKDMQLIISQQVDAIMRILYASNEHNDESMTLILKKDPVLIDTNRFLKVVKSLKLATHSLFSNIINLFN